MKHLSCFVVAWVVLFTTGCSASPALTEIHTVGFGSCLRQDKPAPILDAIPKSHPDLFVFLGDNIYGDSDDIAVLKSKYAMVDAMSGFAALRATCPLLAIWDDHDMGKNDAGVEYPQKQASKKLMLDFFNEPKDSPRWLHDGIYDVRYYASSGKTVQIVLLDTRWFRSQLKRDPTTTATRYISNEDPTLTMLGEAQWAWLKTTLSKPADLRIIASSIQVISDQHRFEKWANFPHERTRLLDMLNNASGQSVILSGDRHFASIHKIQLASKSIYDITASSFNQTASPGKADTEHPLKVVEPYTQPNFGVMKIDWKNGKPVLTLQVLDVAGKVVREAVAE